MRRDGSREEQDDAKEMVRVKESTTIDCIGMRVVKKDIVTDVVTILPITEKAIEEGAIGIVREKGTGTEASKFLAAMSIGIVNPQNYVNLAPSI